MAAPIFHMAAGAPTPVAHLLCDESTHGCKNTIWDERARPRGESALGNRVINVVIKYSSITWIVEAAQRWPRRRRRRATRRVGAFKPPTFARQAFHAIFGQ